MSMRSLAGIILGLFLLLNLGMTAFIYQELTDQSSPQLNQTLELNELREQVNNLTLRVDRKQSSSSPSTDEYRHWK